MAGPFDALLGLDPNVLRGLALAQQNAGPALAAAQNAPEPHPKGFFSGGLMRTLFPTSPDMEGLVSPEDAASARRSELMHLAVALMANSGPRPKGTSSTLSRIGESLAQMPDWSKTVSGVAQLHAGLQQYQDKKAMQAKRQQIIDQFPAGANETPQETGARMLKMYNAFLGIGDTEMTARMSELLPSLLQQRQGQYGQPFAAVGPDGKPGMFVRGPDGQVHPTGLSPYNKPAQPSASAGTSLDNQLSRLWDTETKNQQSRYTTITGALSDADEAIRGNASAQYGFIDNLLRTYNPTMGVRAANLQIFLDKLPLTQRARGEIQRFAEGKGGVSPQTIREGLAALRGLSVQNTADLKRQYTRMARRARVNGRDPELLFDMPPEPDFSRFGLTPTSGAGNTAPTSATDTVRALLGH